MYNVVWHRREEREQPEHGSEVSGGEVMFEEREQPEHDTEVYDSEVVFGCKRWIVPSGEIN